MGGFYTKRISLESKKIHLANLLLAVTQENNSFGHSHIQTGKENGFIYLIPDYPHGLT